MPDGTIKSTGQTDDNEDPRLQAERTLTQMRSGVFGDNIGEALLFFNRIYYPEALPEIAKYLADDDPYTRGLALQVITKYQAPGYIEAARKFLEQDPEISNQVNGADALGFMLRNTKNQEILHVLAGIVVNEAKPQSLRESAYKAMRKIIHYDIREEKTRLGSPFVFPDQVDWDLVRTYLG